MASSSALASSPFLPPLSTPNPRALSLRLPARRLPVASSAAPSGAAAAASARERRRFLERYGLNPDDFEDDAEAEPRVSLFGPSIRGLAEVDSVVVSGDLSLFFFSYRKRGEGIGGTGGRVEGRRRMLRRRRRLSLGRRIKCFRCLWF